MQTANPALLARRRAAARQRLLLHTLEWLALGLLFVVVVFPIAWIVLTAFKHPEDVYRLTLVFTPTLDNFRLAFSDPWRVGEKALHSFVIATTVVVVAIPAATCAAYAFSRLHFVGRAAMFQWLLITQFIPGVVIVLPFFLLFRNLGLLDTYWALIVVNLSIVLPYAVWTIKGAIDAVPRESDEAAMVDGAGIFRTLLDVIVPMARPGIVSAAIFCFVLTWNEFLFALVLTRSEVVPLSVGLIGFRTERGDLWELIAATGIIVTIPMFAFAMAMQRHFTKGINAGASR